MVGNTLGIDIAQASFEVALWQPGSLRQHHFANTAAGFRELSAWLAKQEAGPVQACLEATGVYGLELAHYLYRAGVPVSVVNPACIKAFAQSQLRRSKTDRVDALLIAQFCRTMQPRPWQPPAPEIAELQALARRLEDVQAMALQDRNRVQLPGAPPAVQASQETVLAMLKQEIKALQAQLKAHCQRYPDLQWKLELLRSIPGIGFITAVILLSEIVDLDHYRSARQLAAHGGLVPAHRCSGSSVHGKPRLSKRGNARLRKALYWPAIVAMRHNPLLAAFAQRLLARGKQKMVVIGAVMRKLLHQVYGILKSSKPFDPYHQPCTMCTA
jgi:transposase